MKLKGVVYGKRNCSLCDNRKDNLRKFPALYKKKFGVEVEMEIEYHDAKTVEGLVAYCRDDRANGDIPTVILENEKGEVLRVWNGPEEIVSSRSIIEVLPEVGVPQKK